LDKNSVDWRDDDVACVLYETELYDQRGHGEQDRIFFNRLDSELEKINRFYRAKEAEFIARAVRLERQLLALFQVQEALARRNLKMRTSSFSKAPNYSE
jgi:SPX domain protein involved in polyphosphate accumulation